MAQADDIWFNAVIETMNPANPRAQALAISRGRLMAVGDDHDVLNLQGPSTVLHNLGGQYVLPGFVDSHTHALWGACRDLFDVFVGYQASIDDLVGAVRDRAGKTAPAAVIAGSPWRPEMRPQMGPRPREVLDAVTTAHPVVLQDSTQHVLWCNSLALEQAGITAETTDVDGGVIERDPATGAPSGILAETAGAPVRALIQRSEAQIAQAMHALVRDFNALGLTGFKEPMAYEAELRAYAGADAQQALTLHAAAHIVRSSPFSSEPVAYEEMERLRRDYATENLRTGFAKIFLDGVAPAHTASFIEPYLAESGYDAAAHDPDAALLLTPDALNDTVIELDRRGFVTKMHAVGDNAVRKGLDAIKAARRANSAGGPRHEIAHAAFVSDADLARFRALNAVAEISPKIWFPNAVTAAQIAVLGRDRVEKTHRIRDLLDAGAELTYASDWPAASPDANPWTGLAGMISRRDATGRYDGVLGAGQAISLGQALPLFTLNGARSLGIEHETGSLRTGKWADFIVLKSDLAGQSPEEIGATRVRCTVWQGQIVHMV